MNKAAPNVVYANIFLRFFGFVLSDNKPPRSPPVKAVMPMGMAQDALKSPAAECPTMPIKAVAATMADDVPIATRIGTVE